MSAAEDDDFLEPMGLDKGPEILDVQWAVDYHDGEPPRRVNHGQPEWDCRQAAKGWNAQRGDRLPCTVVQRVVTVSPWEPA